MGFVMPHFLHHLQPHSSRADVKNWWMTLTPRRAMAPDSAEAAAQATLESLFNHGIQTRQMDWKAIVDAVEQGADLHSTIRFDHSHPDSTAAEQLATLAEPKLIDYWLHLHNETLPALVTDALAQSHVPGTPVLLMRLLDHEEHPWQLASAWVDSGVLDQQPPSPMLCPGVALFRRANDPAALSLWHAIAQRPGGRALLRYGDPLRQPSMLHELDGPTAMNAWVGAYAQLERPWGNAHVPSGRFHLAAPRPKPLSQVYAQQGQIGLPMVEALLQHGEPIHGVDHMGNTLLHALMQRNDGPIPDAFLAFFQSAGGLALVNQANQQGEQPLHAWAKALTLPGLEHLEMLIQAGADVNAQDAQGNTPLHHIVRNTTGLLPSSQVLLERLSELGASWIIANHAGKTPIDLVREDIDLYPWIQAHAMQEILIRTMEESTAPARSQRHRL